MSVLQKIRNHGVLLLIIVGVAMMAFVLGDFLNSGSTFLNRNREYVGVIEGNKIHFTDFESLREQITEVYKIEYGRSDFDEATQLSIRSQAWQLLMMDHVLSEQANKIGMMVTPNELSDYCFGSHVHSLIRQRRIFIDQQGNFNRAQVVQFVNSLDMEPEDEAQAENLRQAQTYWLYWEKMVRLSVLQDKYTNLLANLYAVNNLEAKHFVEGREISRDVQYVTKPYYAISDSLVNVDKSEVKKLYKERKELYKQRPHRALEYVVFPITPSPEDHDNAKKYFESLLEEFKTTDDVSFLVNSNSDIRYENINYSESDVPEQYKDFAFNKNAKKGQVSEVSFENNVYSIAKLVDAGYSKSDSVHLKILAQDDQPENDLGWFTERTLNRELIDSAFNNPKNYIFEVVNNGTGKQQKVQIVEKSTPTPKVKLAILARTVYPSSATYSAVYNTAKQFAVEASTNNTFEDEAKERELTVYPAYNVQKIQDKIGDLESSRAIVRWAFEAKKENLVSDVFECGDQYVVANLTDINEDEYRPLRDVQYELYQLALNKKKADYLRDKLANVSTLEEAKNILDEEITPAEAVTFNSQRFGSSGFEPAVIGAAMVLEDNQISEPIEGNTGIFVVQAGPKKGSVGEINYAQEAQQLGGQNTYGFVYQALNYLTEKADIEDNRANFQ